MPLAAAIAGGAVEGINKIDNIEQQTLKGSLEGISLELEPQLSICKQQIALTQL